MVKPYNAKQWEVQAILAGRKTCTRRLVKVPSWYPHFYKLHDNADKVLTGAPNMLYVGFYKDEQIFYVGGEKHIDAVYYKAPCKPGDVLYVRETWERLNCSSCEGDVRTGGCFNEPDSKDGCYVYRATHEISGDARWRPSIHMPKEAARIWLKVTAVRVERLQNITDEQIRKEGLIPEVQGNIAFKWLWDSTVKKSDLSTYGWAANPWVWVIEFERCDKPEPCVLEGKEPAEDKNAVDKLNFKR